MRKNVKKVYILIFLLLLILPIHSQIREFKVIFLEFTDNIKPDSFRQNFSYNSWKSQFFGTRGSKGLRNLLMKFEFNLRNSIKKNEWDNIRSNWLKRLSRAVSISEISEALYRLEINIRWNATFPGWQKKRRLWVKKIQSLY